MYFYCCFQSGIDVNILHCKFQVKLQSLPLISAVCAAALAIENHFFHLYQQTKSSLCRVKFRQTSNWRALEVIKLAYVNKKRDTSQKRSSWDFWWIAKSVLNRVKSAVYFNDPQVLSSASDKNRFLPSFISLSSFTFYNDSETAQYSSNSEDG